MVPSPDTRAAVSPWERVQRLLPLGVSLAITVAAATITYSMTQEVGDLRRYGLLAYPILFALQTVIAATLFLPAPGMVFVAVAAVFLDPLWVGVAAGLGSATGELSGYLLGYYGRRAVPTDTSRVWRLAEHGFRKWGFVALIGLAFIPNPVFDAMGILAGGLRYPISRFWLATATGKVPRSILVAYSASYGGPILTNWLGIGG